MKIDAHANAVNAVLPTAGNNGPDTPEALVTRRTTAGARNRADAASYLPFCSASPD